MTAEALIQELNAFRASQNLRPYQVHSILMEVARGHADYLSATGVVSHFGEGGSRPYQRAISAGYNVAGDLTFGGMYSENLLAESGLTPLQVIEMWKADPRDLETLISPDFQDAGAGMAVGNGIDYYVLVAGKANAGSPAGSSSTPGSEGGTLVAPVVITTTPLEDGSSYHIVQANEALWNIALAYETSVESLKDLNGLLDEDIFEGQRLLVARSATATPTPAITASATLGIPTSTAARPAAPTKTVTPTRVPRAPAIGKNSAVTLAAIVGIALLAAGVGAWLGHRKAI